MTRERGQFSEGLEAKVVRRTTYTFATLEVSRETYDEIEAKLREAGYDHAFVDGAIDMHGIGLVRKPKEGG